MFRPFLFNRWHAVLMCFWCVVQCWLINWFLSSTSYTVSVRFASADCCYQASFLRWLCPVTFVFLFIADFGAWSLVSWELSAREAALLMQVMFYEPCSLLLILSVFVGMLKPAGWELLLEMLLVLCRCCYIQKLLVVYLAVLRMWPVRVCHFHFWG